MKNENTVIAVIAKKGGDGKTPIAFNVAKATKSIVLTNDDDVLEEVHKPYASMLELEQILELDFNELPNTVIDFGGYVEQHIPAIIKKVDFIIMPCKNHISSLKRNKKAIEELSQYNDNIIVVATMTKKNTTIKNGKEVLGDFDNIKSELADYPVKAFFELKDTNIFDNSLDRGLSVDEYLKTAPNLKSIYGKRKNQKFKSILEQWDDLISHVKKEMEK